MMKRALVVALVSAGLFSLGLSTLPSCDGPPNKTCYADRVNAIGVTEDSGPNVACTTCLQSTNAPKACCDAVGACDDDPAKQCIPSFQATHQCVLDGGASEEARCKSLLGNDRARALYGCMRSNCGHECGVPSCDLDPDVVLFGDPTCDGCVGGACCDTVNACSRKRQCKLIVECIIDHCPRTLGPTMTALGQATPDARSAAKNAVCAGRPPSIPGMDAACLERCLDDFAPGGDAGTIDDQAARCLAFGVFSCGAESQCGPRCLQPDAGPYSGGTPWPEDEP